MEQDTYILGINTGHDAGIALIKNSEFIEIINEERFSKQKSHMGFPYLCLS